MLPKDGSILSPAFSASRSCEAMTYTTSNAMKGSTPSAKRSPRAGHWLMSLRTLDVAVGALPLRRRRCDLQLAVRRQLHVARIEAHGDRLCIAQRLAAGKLDAHGIDSFCAGTQQALLEGELAHQIHLGHQVRAADCREGRCRRPVHVCGGQLCVEA